MVLRSPRAILTSDLGRVRDAFSLCIVGYIYVVHSHILIEVKLLESSPVSEKFPGILLLSTGQTQRKRDQSHMLKLSNAT